MFTQIDVPEQTALLQMSYLIERYEAADPNDWRARVQCFDNPGIFESRAIFWIGTEELDPTYPTYKVIDFTSQVEIPFSGWFNILNADEEQIAGIMSNAWTGDIPGSLDFNEYVILDVDLPQIGIRSEGALYRLTVTDVQNIAWSDPSVTPGLFRLRQDVHSSLLLELFDETSVLSVAANELDRAEALLDAYVTIGLPKELNQSEVLRSALRAFPGTSELGLGSVDMIALIDGIDQADSPNDWADQAFNVTNIDQILSDRIDLVHDEIKRGLQRPAVAPDYVGWVLAELGHLRDSAFDLAVDDAYVAQAGGSVSVSDLDGVLVNDIDQEFRSISVDTAFVLDPAYTAPSHGSVTLNADGSLSYQADPVFVGTDLFTYRSMTTIPGVGEPVFSTPATVAIVVPEGGCGVADLTGDGMLNFFDVSAFLVAFNELDAQADLNGDGQYNFFDVSAFLVAFAEGCP